jgi:hypothetical protein
VSLRNYGSLTVSALWNENHFVTADYYRQTDIHARMDEGAATLINENFENPKWRRPPFSHISIIYSG